MKSLCCLAVFSGVLLGMNCAPAFAADAPEHALAFKMKSLDGKEVDLSKYKGKVVLVVNVASRCGATPQYEQLQALYEKYGEQGFVVLGFPCNQFGKQEPGSSTEIREFCTQNYSVTFDLFEKIDVNGEAAAPFYKHLTASAKDAGPVKWNFEKFLIGKDGQVAGRFRTGVSPDDAKVVQAIESQLAR